MLDFPDRGELLQVEEELALMPFFDERGLIPCVTRESTVPQPPMDSAMRKRPDSSINLHN
jgi:hypothetical protein